MKRWKISFFVATVMTAWTLVPASSQANEELVQVVVKYKEKEGQIPAAHTITVVQTPESSVEATIEKLEDHPNIDYAEVDEHVYTQAVPATPNDPDFSPQQKQMFDVLKVAEAWADYTPKQEVIVAVIDSGVDLDHPDLKDSLVEGYNVLDPSAPPVDAEGHGTHVAGLVGATTHNGVGISSIAQNVKIMPIKVLEGDIGYMSNVVKGIYYAVDHGATILNLSLGSMNNMQTLREAIEYATSNGVLVVASAGNDGKNQVMYPAAYEEVISVGSVDTNSLMRAPFSNYGSYVDVYVPGTDLYSTYLDDGYAEMDGTSMSTGIVSSIAAMLKQQAPFLTAPQLAALLETSLESNMVVNSEEAIGQINEYHRVYGATSVETAIRISQSGWTSLASKSLTIKGQSLTGSFVVIATADAFPDSLVASPLASYLDSPILLVKNQQVTESLQAELARLQPSHVVVVGGEQAINSGVEEQIRSMGIDTVRLAGQTRYETAVAVNEVIPYPTNKAFLVSGENYPDALSVASYSGHLQYPLLLTRGAALPVEVQRYLKEHDVTKTYLIGGETVISREVAAQLPGAYRIAGETRYETNFKVHDAFGQTDVAELPLYFATGANFPDALAVGPLAARSGSPVVLVPTSGPVAVQPSINLFLSNYYTILGGEQAISVPSAWAIDKMLSEK